jgi:fucose permease
MVANVFAAAYDVIAPRNFGLAAGVLNMIGGFAAAIMIYLAGHLKDSLGFAGLLKWVALGCLMAALLLVATAGARFGRDRRRAMESAVA